MVDDSFELDVDEDEDDDDEEDDDGVFDDEETAVAGDDRFVFVEEFKL